MHSAKYALFSRKVYSQSFVDNRGGDVSALAVVDNYFLVFQKVKSPPVGRFRRRRAPPGQSG